MPSEYELVEASLKLSISKGADSVLVQLHKHKKLFILNCCVPEPIYFVKKGVVWTFEKITKLYYYHDAYVLVAVDVSY